MLCLHNAPCRLVKFVVLCVLLPLVGCDFGASRTAKSAKTTPIKLKLLVVGDEAIAEAVRPLKAEWQARTGGSFDVRTITPDELTALQTLPDDAVIFPSGQLGFLAERGLIAPLSAEVLKTEELRWRDVFEVLQLREAVWGTQTEAVPFGSPLLVCWYRPDLLEKFDRKPPTTWAEYQQLAEFFNRPENLGNAVLSAEASWAGTLEPRAPGWAGRLLLARAAAYAKHRDSYSTFFNIDTMQPLIDGPPFVRALTELAAAARLQPANLELLDPSGVRQEFLSGHAALALTWPTAAFQLGQQPTKTPVGFIELPGSDKVYSVATKHWEQRSRDEDPHMCFVGISGRLGGVSANCGYPDEALLLLGWLSSSWSQRVSAASPETTLFRHSQTTSPEAWLNPGIDPPAARQYAEGLEESLSRPASLLALRIPGQDEYFAALEEAVATAVAAGKTTEPSTKDESAKVSEALKTAAQRWNEITDRWGRDAQRTAYRHSLGLDQ